MSKVRAIRGATTADENTKDAIVDATREMLESLVEENSFELDDVISAFFTTTKDLNAQFPAVAARKIGWVDVALMCSLMSVPSHASLTQLFIFLTVSKTLSACL